MIKYMKIVVLLLIAAFVLCGCGGSSIRPDDFTGNENSVSSNNGSDILENTVSTLESCDENDRDKEFATIWDFDISTGTLTIGGHGYMKDYAELNSTVYVNGQLQPYVEWWQHIENIKKVVIEDGVTKIGANSFIGCTNLTDVSIPDSVRIIGDAAFEKCSNLTSIELPFGISRINKLAFARCDELKKVEIPNSVKIIGEGAFWSCGKLEDITIPASVEDIGANAFSETPWINNQPTDNGFLIVNDILLLGKDASGNVIIPDYVRQIVGQTFLFNTKIESVTIPASVQKIGVSAFEGCANLRKAVFNCDSLRFEEALFAHCVQLSEIEFPDNLTVSGDPLLDTAWLDEQKRYNELVIINDVLYDGTNASGDVMIPDSVSYIRCGAFENCHSLQSIVISENVGQVGDYAFRNCESLSDVSILSQNISWGKDVFANTRYELMNCGDDNSIIVWEYDSSLRTITFIGEGRMDDFYYSTNGEPDNRPPWNDLKSEISEIIFDDRITHIGSNAFSCCALNSIKFPLNLESIGAAAFANCNNLINIRFPDSVKSIGERAFNGCSNLKDVKFPNNDSLEIGSFAFGNTLVANVPLPLAGCCGKNGDNISWKYDSSLHKLTISGNGEMEEFFYGSQIHNYSPWFDFRADIAEIEIEDGLTIIGEYSFDGVACHTVKIPYSVKNIENFAFYNCDKLTDVYYGGSTSDWSEIIIGDYGNECLNNVAIHCSDGDY